MCAFPIKPIQEYVLSDLAHVRTVSDLHLIFYGVALARLREALPAPRPDGEFGICFFAVESGQDLKLEGFVEPILKGLGCPAIQQSAWRWRTRQALRVMMGGWIRNEDYNAMLKWIPTTKGWVSASTFFSSEGARLLFERLGIAFSEVVPVDLFHHLPDGPGRIPERKREGPADWIFDYSEYPGDLSGLCYTRCRWGVDDRMGLMLEREPLSCWEGHHNARLQAAAPMLYEALRAIARQDPQAAPCMQDALDAVKDTEWTDWVEHPEPSGTGNLPEDIMKEACGSRSTDDDPTSSIPDPRDMDSYPAREPPDQSTLFRLVTAECEGMMLLGEITDRSNSHIRVRIARPFSGFSTDFHIPYLQRSSWDFLGDAGRIMAQRLLRDLFHLGRWIEKNWNQLAIGYADYLRLIRDMEPPVYYDRNAFLAWRTEQRLLLRQGLMSPAHYQKEFQRVKSENAAFVLGLRRVKTSFLATHYYPQRDHTEDPRVPVSCAGWPSLRLSEELEDQILQCLESGIPPATASADEVPE